MLVTRWRVVIRTFDSFVALVIIKRLLSLQSKLPLDFNFSLGAGNHIIHSLSNVIDFVFSVQVLSDLIVSLHELLKLLLEAIVLIIQV